MQNKDDSGNEVVAFIIVSMVILIVVCICRGLKASSVHGHEVQVVSTPVIIDDAIGNQAVYVINMQERDEHIAAAYRNNGCNGAEDSGECCCNNFFDICGGDGCNGGDDGDGGDGGDCGGGGDGGGGGGGS